jgi:preprotein translocase subunit YajC
MMIGAGEGFGLISMIPFFLIFAVIYFLLIRPQMKEQQRRREQVNALKKGDRVITTGGIYGTVAAVEEHALLIKVSENTKIRVAKSGIAGPVVDGDGAAPQK